MITNKEVKNFLQRLRSQRYSTGVLHVATPAWLEDLRECINLIEKLIEERPESK